ncbi:MAG TPA: 5-oxoprolinase subunit PxpB [Planctomycetota bacterium]
MRFTPMGDAALRIEVGDDPERVRAWEAAIRRAELPGVRSVVPAFATVTVFYAPHEIRYADLLARVEAIPVGAEPAPPAALVTLPVVYDGPDLPFLREHTGLTTEEIVRLHSEPTYRVRMIGFLPGFPYLSGLPPRLAAPRLPTPRRSVPAGSVGIGGAQTGVYPLDSPGGWRLIGRTSVKLYDPAQEPGTLLKAGDLLRFQPVDA